MFEDISDFKGPRLSSSALELARHVAEGGRQVVVFGRNPEAEYLISEKLATALVDDRDLGGSFMGAGVVSLSSLSPNDILVNCSTSVSPIDVQRYLNNNTNAGVIHYSDLHQFDKKIFKAPDFVESFKIEYDENSDFHRNFYSSLYDNESKKTFLNFIRYRYHFDVSAMNEYQVRIAEQYFEDFINLNGNAVVDGGGFDGDTAEEIAKRFPSFGQIHFFEPSTVNMAKAKLRLQHVERVKFYECALSDASGSLAFDPDAGSASQVISDAGKVVKVPCHRLDDIIAGQIDFIKLDLEGWELKALQGGKFVISRDRPKLAIAIYHAAEDLREIVTWVLNIYGAGRVKFYLRHYTQGWSETILYCIPV